MHLSGVGEMFVSGYVRENVTIDIALDEGRVRLTAVPKGEEVVKIAPGMAPKAEFQVDPATVDTIQTTISGSDRFILKYPKDRSLMTIFGASNLFAFFQSEGAAPRKAIALFYQYAWTTFEKNSAVLRYVEKLDTEYVHLFLQMFQHVRETLTLAAFGEIVYSEVARVLFPKSLRTPEMFLHIDEAGNPYVLSRFVDGFNEFMQERLALKEGEGKEQKIRTLKDRQEKIAKKGALPKRDDLDITAVEDRLLGKMLAIALITNHWDLFNNICLANSGCLGKLHNSELVVIVDCGNAFEHGFDGLSSGEAAFHNPDITGLEEIEVINGYKYAFPFDREFPIALPRQLVPDLFDFSSHSFFEGFQSAINDVKQVLTKNTNCIQDAIDRSLDKVTESSSISMRTILGELQGEANGKTKASEQPLYKSTLLDRNFYKLTQDKKSSCSGECDDSYTLESVLKSRVDFLAQVSSGIAREREKYQYEPRENFKLAMQAYIDRFNRQQLLKFKALQSTSYTHLKKIPSVSTTGLFKIEARKSALEQAAPSRLHSRL